MHRFSPKVFWHSTFAILSTFNNCLFFIRTFSLDTHSNPTFYEFPLLVFTPDLVFWLHTNFLSYSSSFKTPFSDSKFIACVKPWSFRAIFHAANEFS